ncbi:MAG: Rieske (2Fe-2S) protein, partial [Pseudomonadota bacterium]
MPGSPNNHGPDILGVDDLVTVIKTHGDGQKTLPSILPAQCYYDEALANLEQTQIFAHAWQCLGRVDDIPKRGDYICDHLGADPIFVIRGHDETIKAFSNICRHRMTSLLQGTGNTRVITCPYHGWSYNLQGSLQGAGYMPKTFDKSKIRLPVIRTEIWQGWIYATLDDALPPLAE